MKRALILPLTLLWFTFPGPSRSVAQDSERPPECPQWDKIAIPPTGRADRAHPLRTAEPKLEKYEIVEHLAKGGSDQGADYAFDYNGWKSPN